MRTEKDSLGELKIPGDALYGIHSERARQNFPDHTPFPIEWYKALALVKQACYLTAIDFIRKAGEKTALDTKPVKMPSDLSGHKELRIPKKQVGSSIMPGKVNPVIPEFVISAVSRIYANDLIITRLSGQGCLELNAYLPVIGHALIESLKLLMACNQSFRIHLMSGLEIDADLSRQHTMKSPAMATALLPYIGYNQAAKLALLMKNKSLDIFEANRELKIMDEVRLRRILQPENLVGGGYLLNDLDE